ncbi:MAG: hypothetical protein ACE5JP_10740 [Candidatus Bipolaricaulia bacterium]
MKRHIQIGVIDIRHRWIALWGVVLLLLGLTGCITIPIGIGIGPGEEAQDYLDRAAEIIRDEGAVTPAAIDYLRVAQSEIAVLQGRTDDPGVRSTLVPAESLIVLARTEDDPLRALDMVRTAQSLVEDAVDRIEELEAEASEDEFDSDFDFDFEDEGPFIVAPLPSPLFVGVNGGSDQGGILSLGAEAGSGNFRIGGAFRFTGN